MVGFLPESRRNFADGATADFPNIDIFARIPKT